MTIEEHYNAIAPKLLNWLVATGSSHAEASDLVQETFLRIWRMRDDLSDDPSAVSGLAFTTARNLRKNLWRDNARLTFVDEIRDGDGGAAAPPTNSPPRPKNAAPNSASSSPPPSPSSRRPSAKLTPSSRSPACPSARFPPRPAPPKTSSKSAYSGRKTNSAKFFPKWV